jgi:hypothetical protein
MARLAILSALSLLALAAPASAQPVVYDPGRCAQFYPNANCQNYGPGNPFTSWGTPYASYGGHDAYGRSGHYPRRVQHKRYHQP